jgi:hypothetical protein
MAKKKTEGGEFSRLCIDCAYGDRLAESDPCCDCYANLSHPNWKSKADVDKPPELMQVFVTFGPEHSHKIGEVTVDQDYVAVINCVNRLEGREIAIELFGKKWCSVVPMSRWPRNSQYYRGKVEVW